MKRYSKAWYELEVYGVIGRKPNTENDARMIVTKSNARKAAVKLNHMGYSELRLVEMGKIKTLGASQAREVNTFTPDFF